MTMRAGRKAKAHKDKSQQAGSSRHMHSEITGPPRPPVAPGAFTKSKVELEVCFSDPGLALTRLPKNFGRVDDCADMGKLVSCLGIDLVGVYCGCRGLTISTLQGGAGAGTAAEFSEGGRAEVGASSSGRRSPAAGVSGGCQGVAWQVFGRGQQRTSGQQGLGQQGPGIGVRKRNSGGSTENGSNGGKCCIVKLKVVFGNVEKYFVEDQPHGTHRDEKQQSVAYASTHSGSTHSAISSVRNGYRKNGLTVHRDQNIPFSSDSISTLYNGTPPYSGVAKIYDPRDLPPCSSRQSVQATTTAGARYGQPCAGRLFSSDSSISIDIVTSTDTPQGGFSHSSGTTRTAEAGHRAMRLKRVKPGTLVMILYDNANAILYSVEGDRIKKAARDLARILKTGRADLFRTRILFAFDTLDFEEQFREVFSRWVKESERLGSFVLTGNVVGGGARSGGGGKNGGGVSGGIHEKGAGESASEVNGEQGKAAGSGNGKSASGKIGPENNVLTKREKALRSVTESAEVEESSSLQHFEWRFEGRRIDHSDNGRRAPSSFTIDTTASSSHNEKASIVSSTAPSHQSQTTSPSSMEEQISTTFVVKKTTFARVEDDPMPIPQQSHPKNKKKDDLYYVRSFRGWRIERSYYKEIDGGFLPEILFEKSGRTMGMSGSTGVASTGGTMEISTVGMVLSPRASGGGRAPGGGTPGDRAPVRTSGADGPPHVDTSASSDHTTHLPSNTTSIGGSKCSSILPGSGSTPRLHILASFNKCPGFQAKYRSMGPLLRGKRGRDFFPLRSTGRGISSIGLSNTMSSTMGSCSTTGTSASSGVVSLSVGNLTEFCDVPVLGPFSDSFQSACFHHGKRSQVRKTFLHFDDIFSAIPGGDEVENDKNFDVINTKQRSRSHDGVLHVHSFFKEGSPLLSFSERSLFERSPPSQRSFLLSTGFSSWLCTKSALIFALVPPPAVEGDPSSALSEFLDIAELFFEMWDLGMSPLVSVSGVQQ